MSYSNCYACGGTGFLFPSPLWVLRELQKNQNLSMSDRLVLENTVTRCEGQAHYRAEVINLADHRDS